MIYLLNVEVTLIPRVVYKRCACCAAIFLLCKLENCLFLSCLMGVIEIDYVFMYLLWREKVNIVEGSIIRHLI